MSMNTKQNTSIDSSYHYSVDERLRIIWNHVKALTEMQMAPIPENRIKLQRAEQSFLKAEQLASTILKKHHEDNSDKDSSGV